MSLYSFMEFLLILECFWMCEMQLCDLFFVEVQAREFLSKHGDLSQTQIFAKIENVEVGFFYFKRCLL